LIYATILTPASWVENPKSIQYKRSILGNKQWYEIKEELDVLTSSGNFSDRPRIQIFEIHAVDNPSFHDLVKDGHLPRWKEAAKQSNTTLFTFTFLRQPLPWALSHYYMACIVQKDCQPPEMGIPNATSLDDLTSLATPNPQCGFLYRGGVPYHYNPRWSFTPTVEQCEDIWQDLITYMDWVGLVESYDTTMSLLEKIVGREVPVVKANVRISEKKLRMEDVINTSAEEKLQLMHELDEDLYRKVKGHFTMDMWQSSSPSQIP
jgi:hypothetical protein